jgi:hypothetical protein
MEKIRNLLIVLLLLVLGFFVCSPNRDSITSTTITKVDTIYKHDTLVKYKKGNLIPFVVLDTLYLIDSMVIHDTTKMVNDYLSAKAYSDTLHINSDSRVYIQDTISQNRIIGRSYTADFTTKTILVNTTNTIYKNKNELFVGLIGDLRRFDQKVGVGVGINYKKKNESYTLNFTTNQISLGFYKKLF